jgi:hypothetical protein
MSLFRYTRDEYDKMFIRLPDDRVQYNTNNLTQRSFNMIYYYVNRDGMMYTGNDVRIMIRLLSQYFSFFNNQDRNDICCRDANNNIASLNDIVIECFNLRN